MVTMQQNKLIRNKQNFYFYVAIAQQQVQLIDTSPAH